MILSFVHSICTMTRSRRIVVMNMPSRYVAQQKYTQIRYAPIFRGICRGIYYTDSRGKYIAGGRRRFVASAFNVPVLDIIVHKGAVSVPVAVCRDRNLPTLPRAL